MRPQKINSIFSPISQLPGVGPKIEGLFNRMGIYRYIHFLWHIPYNLIKREKHRNIHEAQINSLVTLKLKILEHKPSRFKRQPYRIHCLCEDTPIDIVYFYARHPVIRSTLPIGKERYVSGKLEFFRNNFQITHPSHVIKTEHLNEMKDVEPIYGLTAGLSQRIVLKYMQKILTSLPELEEWIEEKYTNKYSFHSWKESLLTIHNPENIEDLINNNIFRRRFTTNTNLI